MLELPGFEAHAGSFHHHQNQHYMEDKLQGVSECAIRQNPHIMGHDRHSVQ